MRLRDSSWSDDFMVRRVRLMADGEDGDEGLGNWWEWRGGKILARADSAFACRVCGLEVVEGRGRASRSRLHVRNEQHRICCIEP